MDVASTVLDLDGEGGGSSCAMAFWKRRGLPFLLLAWVASMPTRAHDGPHGSVHDTVAGILHRMSRTFPTNALQQLKLEDVLPVLTLKEREILGRDHLTFRVATDAVVTVLKDVRATNDPFWLVERGFERRPTEVVRGRVRFEAWEKAFPAGEIGLGVSSISGVGEHYLVTVRAVDGARPLSLQTVFPAQLRVGEFTNGIAPYADREETLTNVPPELQGQVIVRTLHARGGDGRLLGLFRWTDHRSSDRPDHVVLTWSGDPRTSQTIQWRTGPRTRVGQVAYGKAADLDSPRGRKPIRVKAVSAGLKDEHLLNDPLIMRHTVELKGLEPGTRYRYSVGDGSRGGWDEYREFTTAPGGVVPFSFVYMGDAQNGLDRWGTLVHNAYRERPDAAFYLMAGDLVNRGAQRDDWDSFFHNASDIFDRRTLVPLIGNHECQGGHPTLYLKQFKLPSNGPAGMERGRAYSFEYSNAQFIILDSNLEPATQTRWLEQQLAASRARWRFVACHHPAYPSAVGRSNDELFREWTPVFDKYHVDVVLQGHDHAYLRTFPMKEGKPVATPAEGTVYVVSVSGTKFYPQAPHDYTQVGMTNVATWQVLDIQVSGDRLHYVAKDIDGMVRDRFVIEKK